MIRIRIAQFLSAESRVCGPDPGFPLGSDPDLNSGKNELEDMKTEYLSVRNHDPDPHHPIFMHSIKCLGSDPHGSEGKHGSGSTAPNFYPPNHK